MSEWSQYRKKSFQEMRAYVPGEALPIYVSVSVADKTGGSPKLGDMVARNPGNHADQRLVAEDFFHDNYEPAPAPGSVTITAKSLDEIIEAERERDALRSENERLFAELESLRDAVAEAGKLRDQRDALAAAAEVLLQGREGLQVVAFVPVFWSPGEPGSGRQKAASTVGADQLRVALRLVGRLQKEES